MIRLCTGRKRRANVWAVVSLLLCFALASCDSFASSPSGVHASLSQRLNQLSGDLDDAKQAERTGQGATMHVDVQHFASGWQQIRHEAFQQAPEQAQAIDVALRQVLTTAKDTAPSDRALNDLDAAVDRFLAAAGQGKTVTIAGEDRMLEEALHALQSGNLPVARQELADFASGWPFVETQVKQQDAQTYALIERSLPLAQQALEAQPPDLSLAIAAIHQMESALHHSSAVVTSYGPLDAAVILVREGLEAILVISALLAVLRKSNASDQQHWVWLGGAGGILASVVLALLIRSVFVEMEASVNPELLEGIAGVFAAIVLVYMSWWMHGKAPARSWQQYVRQQSRRIIGSGRMVALGLLAFFAVFREGAETLLFYIGIAPSISQSSLILGTVIGFAVLGMLAWVVIGLGVRLPLRAFFVVASMLVFYLALKFLGTGIHALQVAGALPVTPAWQLPTLEIIGFYPSWETVLPQAILIVGAVFVIGILPWLRRPVEADDSR